MHLLHDEMNNGLRRNSNHMADIKMFPTFVRSLPDGKDHLPLGFTFSFPCRQEGLAKARLSKWTKGFRCEGVVGEDICYLLHEALKRRNIKGVEVIAVVNDAVGTLMSTAHGDRNCEIGLILGKYNMFYFPLIENICISTYNVLINTEWGAFGDNGCLDFIRTEYDRELDTFSVNPGKQM
ncbi:hypothetical protein KUTeg_005469 [Tegillarca granosa]|uniref:Phosphotransferase n=1 Tax=Tegillarca granosa TaxID=220873 RepID=A0ABQ9FPB2_TEGGR|nr:hypothetical protein KUTeg_005469 [Tegillarca granosa]